MDSSGRRIEGDSVRLTTYRQAAIRNLSFSQLEASFGSLPNASFSYVDAVALSRSSSATGKGGQQQPSPLVAPQSAPNADIAPAPFNTELGKGLGIVAHSNHGIVVGADREHSFIVLPPGTKVHSMFEKLTPDSCSASNAPTDSIASSESRTVCSPISTVQTAIISASEFSQDKTTVDSLCHNLSNPCEDPSDTELFTGWKWECLEYSRRWLILRYGVTFLELVGANCLWKHEEFFFLHNGTPAPFTRCTNRKSKRPPSIGSLIIYPIVRASQMDFGHVAGVVDVVLGEKHSCVRVAEQNWDNKPWLHPTYSREIPLKFDAVTETYSLDQGEDFPICGWLDFNSDVATIKEGNADEQQDLQEPNSIV